MRGTTSRRSGRRGQAPAALSAPGQTPASDEATLQLGHWSLAKAFARTRAYASSDLATGAALAAALDHVNAGFALAVGPEGQPIASAASPTAAHELTARDYEQTFAAAASALGGLPAGNPQLFALRLQAEGRVVGALALKPTDAAEAEAFRSAASLLGECLAEMLDIEPQSTPAVAAEPPPTTVRAGERERMGERLTDALASHDDGVALFDADGGLVAANPAFAAAHGARVRELRGLTIEEILRRRDDGLSPAWLGRDLAASNGAQFALAADGRWLRLAFSASPGGDKMVLQSPADHLPASIADARRRAQAADAANAERLAIWDGVAAGVVLLSEAGRVLDVNQEAARMMGAPARRLKGRKVGRLEGAEAESWSRVRADADDAPALVVRARKLADGRTLLTMMQAPLVADATGQGVDDPRVQRALAAAEALGELGHEMRTPLNAVIGFADILMARSFGPVNERQAQYLGDIGRAGRHMLEMVEHMFDHAQLTAGRYPFNPEWVDLAELLQEAGRMLQPIAAEGSVKLSVGPTPQLEAFVDRGAMLQALINLLANGVKFTPGGGEVRLGGRLGHDALQLQVADTGEGIPAADLERVLEPFTQARRLGANPLKGVGLGLSIVTALAELHGGTVKIDSELGKGSVVTINLPADKVRQLRSV